jgi:hypothetical protein
LDPGVHTAGQQQERGEMCGKQFHAMSLRY